MPESIPERTRKLRAVMDRNGWFTRHETAPKGCGHNLIIDTPDGDLGVYVEADKYQVVGLDGKFESTHQDIVSVMEAIRRIQRKEAEK